MGGRGSSGGGGGGGFKTPNITGGTEKQIAWASRILNGFYDQMTEKAAELRKGETHYGSSGKEYKRDATKKEIALANAYRDTAKEYKDAMRDPRAVEIYSNAKKIIDNRNNISATLEKMVDQKYRKEVEKIGEKGLPNNQKIYIYVSR